MTRYVKTLLACICLFALATNATADCARSLPAHQRRDAGTIRQLEAAWNLAFLTGNIEFERCLLTSDFTEIMSTGHIYQLSDELALAEKNKGKKVTSSMTPKITVHIHGNVAVAYGISSEKVVDGRPHKSYYADFYVRNSEAWHVFFAQQTAFAV